MTSDFSLALSLFFCVVPVFLLEKTKSSIAISISLCLVVIFLAFGVNDAPNLLRTFAPFSSEFALSLVRVVILAAIVFTLTFLSWNETVIKQPSTRRFLSCSSLLILEALWIFIGFRYLSFMKVFSDICPAWLRFINSMPTLLAYSFLVQVHMLAMTLLNDGMGLSMAPSSHLYQIKSLLAHLKTSPSRTSPSDASTIEAVETLAAGIVCQAAELPPSALGIFQASGLLNAAHDAGLASASEVEVGMGDHSSGGVGGSASVARRRGSASEQMVANVPSPHVVLSSALTGADAQLQRDFLRNVTHCLRTPLQSVIALYTTALQLDRWLLPGHLRHPNGLSADQGTAMLRSLAAAETLLHTLDNLLELTELDLTAAPPPPPPPPPPPTQWPTLQRIIEEAIVDESYSGMLASIDVLIHRRLPLQPRAQMWTNGVVPILKNLLSVCVAHTDAHSPILVDFSMAPDVLMPSKFSSQRAAAALGSRRALDVCLHVEFIRVTSLLSEAELRHVWCTLPNDFPAASSEVAAATSFAAAVVDSRCTAFLTRKLAKKVGGQLFATFHQDAELGLSVCVHLLLRTSVLVPVPLIADLADLDIGRRLPSASSSDTAHATVSLEDVALLSAKDLRELQSKPAQLSLPQFQSAPESGSKGLEYQLTPGAARDTSVFSPIAPVPAVSAVSSAGCKAAIRWRNDAALVSERQLWEDIWRRHYDEATAWPRLPHVFLIVVAASPCQEYVLVKAGEGSFATVIVIDGLRNWRQLAADAPAPELSVRILSSSASTPSSLPPSHTVSCSISICLADEDFLVHAPPAVIDALAAVMTTLTMPLDASLALSDSEPICSPALSSAASTSAASTSAASTSAASTLNSSASSVSSSPLAVVVAPPLALVIGLASFDQFQAYEIDARTRLHAVLQAIGLRGLDLAEQSQSTLGAGTAVGSAARSSVQPPGPLLTSGGYYRCLTPLRCLTLFEHLAAFRPSPPPPTPTRYRLLSKTLNNTLPVPDPTLEPEPATSSAVSPLNASLDALLLPLTQPALSLQQLSQPSRPASAASSRASSRASSSLNSSPSLAVRCMPSPDAAAFATLATPPRPPARPLPPPTVDLRAAAVAAAIAREMTFNPTATFLNSAALNGSGSSPPARRVSSLLMQLSDRVRRSAPPLPRGGVLKSESELGSWSDSPLGDYRLAVTSERVDAPKGVQAEAGPKEVSVGPVQVKVLTAGGAEVGDDSDAASQSLLVKRREIAAFQVKAASSSFEFLRTSTPSSPMHLESATLTSSDDAARAMSVSPKARSRAVDLMHLTHFALSQPALRMLIVDDLKFNQKALHLQLKQAAAGAQVEIDFASDGQQAVDAVQKAAFDNKPYHIVWMDLQMPVMDGLTATRTIREWEVEMPLMQRHEIIAVTANKLAEDEANAFAAGVDAFLPKPVALAKLKTTIGRVRQSLGLTKQAQTD